MNLVNLYALVSGGRCAVGTGRGVRLAYLAQLPRLSGAFGEPQRGLMMYRFDTLGLTFFRLMNFTARPPGFR